MDSVDRKILTLLQSDGSLSHAQLAEHVGASAASCWRRVKALESSGILQKVVRLVDPGKIERGVNVLCNIRIVSHASDQRDAFEKFIHSRPEVLECFSITGDWDYLLRVVVSDVAGYNHFLMQILLGHPSVAGASSQFALELTKYTTALPV